MEDGQWVDMLKPFLGISDADMDPKSIFHGMWDDYINLGPRLFEPVEHIEDAQLVVPPVPWQDRDERFFELIAKAKANEKQTVIFFHDDSDEPVCLDSAYVTIFRTSFYRTTRLNNEFALPAWHEDFVKKYLAGKLKVRKRGSKPIVGFCGHVEPYTLGKRLHTNLSHMRYAVRRYIKGKPFCLDLNLWLLNKVKHFSNITARSKAVFSCKKSDLVDHNFIMRDSFGIVDNNVFVSERTRSLRLEYVNNIIDSDYTLCGRGAGNFSFRLYETLCCGRIPIFVDTDCIFPYEPFIDWKKIGIWVDYRDIKHIDEIVLTYHQNISPEDFENRQIENRKIWEEWLSVAGFFKNFYRHF